MADGDNNRIQKWVSGASIGITVAGGNGAGRASYQLDNPQGVFLDAVGDIFVAGANNNRVQKFEIQNNVAIRKPDTSEQKPAIPPQIFTSLDWQEPVSNPNSLAGGVFNAAVSSIKIEVRINSSLPINEDNIQVLLSGQKLEQGNKMHTVEFKRTRSAGGKNKKYECLFSRVLTIPDGNSMLQVACGADSTDILNL